MRKVIVRFLGGVFMVTAVGCCLYLDPVISAPMAVLGVAGVGIILLKSWGRLLAVGLLCVPLASGIFLFVGTLIMMAFIRHLDPLGLTIVTGGLILAVVSGAIILFLTRPKTIAVFS